MNQRSRLLRVPGGLRYCCRRPLRRPGGVAASAERGSTCTSTPRELVRGNLLLIPDPFTQISSQVWDNQFSVK